MRAELFGQSFATEDDVQRILKEKAWSVAHFISPGAEEYVWPKVYNALQDALREGTVQHQWLAPLLGTAVETDVMLAETRF